ncbi:MAG: aldo/keto reductase [Myxococcota bacterium]|nr:aldo/keto reductase [Myxococcota bacterium]
MQTRRLGDGLEVSALGLGCMGLSQAYGRADPAEAEATLRRAVERGVRLFDTADVYGLGRNEELVGRVLAPVRDRVVLATKCGIVAGEKGPTGVDGRPERVAACCDASLARLGTDAIDLYYLHRVDPQVPIEETVGAMAELVRAGKVRHLGLSEAGSATLRRACAVHPVAALQSEYSLWSREPEAGVLATCRELGVGFVAFSPLGRGFLAGAVRGEEDLDAEGDVRRAFPRFQPGNLERNLELLRAFEAEAEALGCTPGQLALAWVLARGDDVVPIPGTKRVARLEENLAAAELALPPDALARLERLFPPGAVAGDRYSDRMRRTVPVEEEA